MNKFNGIKVEYHILQSFPVTCLNRDDVGAPKTAIVGGVERGRISSQCWKRQVRLALREHGVRIAVRTKRISQMIESFCTGERNEEKSRYIGQMAEAISSKDTLFFISENEARALADYADNVTDFKKELERKDLNKVLAKELTKLLKDKGLTGLNNLDGLDIALFGRMVANATELNVQAACSFAHAITTHRISSEVDYFTAVDDFLAESEEHGAGHIGSNEFNSGTYYRYVCLDLGLLVDNMGDDLDLGKAVDAFTKALFTAMPAARQNTFAGYSPWDYADILVRRGQNVLVCFDKPVRSSGNGYLEPSRKELEDKIRSNERLMGSLYGKIAEFTYGVDTNFNIDDLCNALSRSIVSIQDVN